MVKDTVQSLKAEDDKLTEKVEEVYVELKKVHENVKENHAMLQVHLIQMH